MKFPVGSVWEADEGSLIWVVFVVVRDVGPFKTALVLTGYERPELTGPGATFSFDARHGFAKRCRRLA